MADSADIDLYSDDIEQGFGQIKVIKWCIFFIAKCISKLITFQFNKDDYVGDEDLYDDVVAAPSSEPHERNDAENGSGPPIDRIDCGDTNGSYMHISNNVAPNHVGRRHQLYVGNLTWV